MELNKLAAEINVNAVEKGFWETKPSQIEQKLLLMVTEIAEACEAHRKGKWTPEGYCQKILSLEGKEFVDRFEVEVKNNIEDEMADTIIRILDFCYFYKIDIDSHIEAKMKYNKTRDYLHGKKY